jgi:hypothetical protein
MITAMQRGHVVARSTFAILEADARMRWSLQPPSFDPQLPTGPFTTLVAFLPQAFAAELADSIAAMPGLAEHYRYAPTQLHVTVRNLDGADLADISALLGGLNPICLNLDGLSFTRETLLLRLLSPDQTLRGLRVALDDLPGARPRPRASGELAFANVLRLNGPVTSELRRGIRTYRPTRAQIVLDALTVVRTDKVGDPRRTTVLRRYPLAA